MKAHGQLSAMVALPPVQESTVQIAQKTPWPPQLFCC